MTEQEVIIVNGIPAPVYNAIIERAVRYALISIPFTYNRMAIEDLNRKIQNVAKGKTAEMLFRYFCLQNDIEVDFDSCTTLFFTSDKRDFLAGGFEWDIKNNFIYFNNQNDATAVQYTRLPALIPNKFKGDQWSKREINEFENSSGVRYLFTFMRNIYSGDKRSDYFRVDLSEEQLHVIFTLYQQYENSHVTESPFTEKYFFDQLKFDRKQINIIQHPDLVITGYAGKEQWNLFEDSGDEIRKYCNGILTTKINNRMAAVGQLPSFLSLYPHLQQQIKCGVLSNHKGLRNVRQY